MIVSDLHLGDRAEGDVLRRDGAADALFAAVAGVDRLVLLGDSLELRNRPVGEVLEACEPFFNRLGEALAGRQLVLVAGNHDHALVERWLTRREDPLGLEQRMTPKKASDLAHALASQMPGANVELAYPGLWLREDVYATHGHYLDVHMTVPTFERIAISVSGRIALERSGRWSDVHDPDDYEGLLAPVYAWSHMAAQSGTPGQATSGSAAIRAWRTLRAGRSGGGPRARALAAAFPLAVGALNAAGLGPLSSELSDEELRRAGLRAMSEVVERLRIRARHVIFGHTHRAGMLESDTPAEWLTPNGVQLHNTGSWVYSKTFLARGDPRSPYWPGCAVLLEGGAPPQLLRLLADRTPAALSGAHVN